MFLHFLIIISILADFNESERWMISSCPLISKSFHSTPSTIGITVTFMFYRCLFLFSNKVYVLIALFVFFYFHSLVFAN